MRPQMLPAVGALLLAALAGPTTAATPKIFPKRGLVYLESTGHPKDNAIWLSTNGGAALSWYYNYGPIPSRQFNATPQSELEFVPMLWGAPGGESLDDTSFLEKIKSLVASGRNISHVMAFNEPDGPWDWGGSNMRPDVAARVWANNFPPLRELGIKVSLPSVIGAGDPFEWMAPFLANCSLYLTQLSGSNGTARNCTADFMPVHVYGGFDDLAGRIATFYNA